MPDLVVGKKISCYGPFKLSAKFLFSDFSHWSEGQNAGFNQLIEEARGKKCIFDIGKMEIPKNNRISTYIYGKTRVPLFIQVNYI